MYCIAKSFFPSRALDLINVILTLSYVTEVNSYFFIILNLYLIFLIFAFYMHTYFECVSMPSSISLYIFFSETVSLVESGSSWFS